MRKSKCSFCWLLKFFFASCDLNYIRYASIIKINLPCVARMCISNLNFYIKRLNISPRILITHYEQTLKIGDNWLIQILITIPFKLIPTLRRRAKNYSGSVLPQAIFLRPHSCVLTRFFSPFYIDKLIFRWNAQHSCWQHFLLWLWFKASYMNISDFMTFLTLVNSHK